VPRLPSPARLVYLPMALAGSIRDERDVAPFLASEKRLLVEASAAAVRSAAPHYQGTEPEEVRARLERLYDEVTGAADSRDLGCIIQYAAELAEERFFAGYDLSEVQVAFNTLEEAIWARIISESRPEQLASALGIVSTILGAAKDALARRYVSLATRTHAPSLDFVSLFTGSGGS
jgi:hypothetical protein